MLASTTSAASFSRSSSCSDRGERGSAIKPVRVDSRIPKGPMSFMKESIRDGLAELEAEGQSSILYTKPSRSKTYSSTMQLLLLISRTLPPNWWVRRVIASRCSCLCLRA